MNKFVILTVCFWLLLGCQANTDTSRLGQSCTVDLDCSPPEIVCSSSVCKHKKLFPLTANEQLATVTITSLIMLCSIVGVSGGIIVVPFSALLMGFNAKQAVALANTIAVFQTLIKYLMGLFKQHPQANHKTIVDYNIGLIMLVPFALFSVIGAIVETLLPEVVTLLLFCVSLFTACCYGVYHLCQKYQMRQLTKSEGGNQPHLEGLLPGTGSVVPGDQQQAERGASSDERDEMAKQLSAQDLGTQIEEQKRIENSNFYPKKFLPILAVVVLSILVSVFRPGKNPVSTIGISKCSAGDWLVLFGYAALMLGLVAYTFRLVLREQVHKQAIGWKFDSLEVQHTKKMLVIETICCSAAGFIITIIGISAGIPMNPMLSIIGYSPITASWTINLTNLVSKIAAVVVHIMYGDLLYDYVFFYGGFVVVGVIISENLALFVIKKFKSLLMYPVIYLFVCLVGLVLALYVNIGKWITDNSHGVDVWKFNSYC